MKGLGMNIELTLQYSHNFYDQDVSKIELYKFADSPSEL